MDEKIVAAIRKKAKGYKVTEKVEEKQLVDGEMQVVKVRLSTKEVPCDISAVKFLSEMEAEKILDDMTEDELKAEKLRLLREFGEIYNGTVKK